MFSKNSPNYTSLAVSFSCTVNKELHEGTVVFKNKCFQKFCKFQWKTPVLQALRPANLLKRSSNKSVFFVKSIRTPFSTGQLRWLFKIRNSNNLFKDVSAISLTHNQSLITCNSHNDKLIWKCIHLPKTCSDRAFL